MTSAGPIVVLSGPTAVGKTAAAVALCRRLDGEIVGADSVQVYRGLDIGSAKPSPAELAGVPHHLLDVVDPDEAIDAARYARLADTAIAAIQQRGRVAVVCGGTGLWLRALLRGLLPLPPVEPALRAALESRFDSLGGEALHAELARVDPDSAGTIHPNDKLRIVRALEVHAQTGQPLGRLRREHALGEPRYRALHLYLDRDRPSWRERVSLRCRQMLEAGWVDEVLGLVERHPEPPRALSSVGYRQVLAHLRGELSADDLAPAIEAATHGFGKRQRTWFNADPTVTRRTSPEALTGDELGAIEAHLDTAGA